jgi:hypothetical protein
MYNTWTIINSNEITHPDLKRKSKLRKVSLSMISFKKSTIFYKERVNKK